MRRIRPALTLIAGLAGIGQAQEAMTLSQALSRLEQGNNSLKASGAKVETAHEAHKASYGNFMPLVKVEASAFHLDREIDMDLNAIRSGMIEMQTYNMMQFKSSEMQSVIQKQYGALPSAYQTSENLAKITSTVQSAYQTNVNQALQAELPSFSSTFAEQNDWEASVIAYQPLFHGGKILAAERITAARERAATADREKQKADLTRDFTRLYVQGTLLKQSISLRQQAITSITRHRDQAKKIVDVGMADRAALLRAEMALAEARTALSDDSAKLQSVRLTLAQMAGEDGSLDPLDSLPPPPRLSGTPDDHERQVAEHNPLLSSLSAQQDVAHKAVAVKSADFLPQIGLFGKYEFNRDAARSSLQPIWAVGIKGEMTLFHGGDDYHQRQAALSTEREVSALRAEAKSALGAQVRRQTLALEQARIRWENLDAQCQLSRENHRVTEARFAQGQATGLEVVDAWLATEKADLEKLSAAGEGWLGLNEILWAEGNTSEFVNIWTGARK